MKKIFFILATTMTLSFSSEVDNLCYQKFEAKDIDGMNYRAELYHVCINGYSYTATGLREYLHNAIKNRVQFEGLVQNFEIIDAEKGVSIPSVCKCSLMGLKGEK